MDPIMMASLLMGMMNGGSGSSGSPGGSGGSSGGVGGTGFMGIIPLLIGASERKKGAEAAARNVRPELNESGLYSNLLGMFEKQAQYGIDKNALTFATEKNQDALTSSLHALTIAGGNPNLVSELYGSFADSMQNLAIADSDKRWQKVSAIAGATDRLFDAKREEFLYNQDAPYKDKAQSSAAQQQAGFQQEMAGLDMIMGNSVKTNNANYQQPGTGQDSFIQQFMAAMQKMFSSGNTGNTTGINNITQPS